MAWAIRNPKGSSLSQDERERAKFRSRRMFETDLASDMATGLTREEVENLGV